MERLAKIMQDKGLTKPLIEKIFRINEERRRLYHRERFGGILKALVEEKKDIKLHAEHQDFITRDTYDTLMEACRICEGIGCWAEIRVEHLNAWERRALDNTIMKDHYEQGWNPLYTHYGRKGSELTMYVRISFASASVRYLSDSGSD